MADNGQKKEQKQAERVVPGIESGKSSLVSKAAGNVSSSRARVEQRASAPGTRSGSSKRSSGSGGKPRPKKAVTTSAATPADSRLINQVRNKWEDMQPHEQQRLFSLILLGLALLLLLSLTVWHAAPVFSQLAGFFFNMFSWAAVPLALGLIAFAVAHLVEGMRNIRFIRWSLVLGLLVLMILLLVETQLIGQDTTGGIIGGVLATPIQGLGFGAHVLVLGLLVMTLLLTFRVTLTQFRAVLRWLQQVFFSPRGSLTEAEEDEREDTPSPFLGQRPRFSRYGGSATPEQAKTVHRRKASIAEDEDEEEDEATVFEDDLEGPLNDPRNDINLHKDQVGTVPKGPRAPLASQPGELRSSLKKGARQLALPDKGVDEPEKVSLIEPLAPNPRLVPATPPRTQPKLKVTRRGSGETPGGSSPWKLPDTLLFNDLENNRLQIRGDDTVALAKMIQDTLRSFRVEAEVRPEDISIGPTVIRFGIRPTGTPLLKEDEKGRMAPVRDTAGNIVYEKRTRVSRIMALQNDLALVLESKTIRMEAPVPGRPYVGVEIPNKNSRMVTLREILDSKEYQAARNRSKLTVALGKDVAGAVRVGDLAKMPHLLIAGATGSGKCLAYDEPVFLADGRIVKVQELIGTDADVIGVTDTHTMQQTPVQATFTENGIQEVFEITFDNGLIIRRTGEHPLWAALLDENQHIGHQANGKAARRTRAIKAGWVQVRDLRVCGNRPDFDGHVILCPLHLTQHGSMPVSDADQKFADCPEGYEWRKIVSIKRIMAPTVNIEVHSDNHAFVGYAVEHNSVMINAIISSVITQASPDDVRLLMVDPKMVELSMYNGIPHLLSPVVIDVEKVVGLLKIAIGEMEQRYRLFSQLGVRNLDGYRRLRAEKKAQGDETLKNLPAIVIIIDELADLMMAAPDEVEGLICRLAQLARATGIHLVVATQRPSVDVITGLIKANIPTRISFMVSSAVDSRTIIDMGGAERLLGRGDMLYLPADAGKPERIQGAFVADEEAERLVSYWQQQAAEHAARVAQDSRQGNQPGVEPAWEVSAQAGGEVELEDELLEQAEQVIQDYGRASISLLQRRLKIGYARAARLMDLLEEQGTIGKAESGGRGREVLEPRALSHKQSMHEGRSMAEEADEIIEEERQRAEFLRKQTERGKP
jgi:DNA segregation ATPase FtsK/SpoIIIE-like protein